MHFRFGVTYSVTCWVRLGSEIYHNKWVMSFYSNWNFITYSNRQVHGIDVSSSWNLGRINCNTLTIVSTESPCLILDDARTPPPPDVPTGFQRRSKANPAGFIEDDMSSVEKADISGKRRGGHEEAGRVTRKKADRLGGGRLSGQVVSMGDFNICRV
jgi:hypothetical protein